MYARTYKHTHTNTQSHMHARTYTHIHTRVHSRTLAGTSPLSPAYVRDTTKDGRPVWRFMVPDGEWAVALLMHVCIASFHVHTHSCHRLNVNIVADY